MSTVIVKFYRLNAEGVAVVCRTEICASIMEADCLASDEMSRGAYSNIEITQQD
jgi:hypothetical protein